MNSFILLHSLYHTATSASGDVSPIKYENTDGDIHLPENNIVILEDSPSLIKLRKRGGGHVISGDGTSLLRAAALMELINRIEEIGGIRE
ncbi:MAG: hypothetical protein PF518_11250 [Spirochaetaceae bacterium]|jgi:hypothetical protein|nr:hypothetical protein [Spirochaetaceae bacterium]